jgi:hypothetical protein
LNSIIEEVSNITAQASIPKIIDVKKDEDDTKNEFESPAEQ